MPRSDANREWLLSPFGAVVANVLVIGALGAFALLDRWDADLFYRSVQEDEWLEWATFWGFAIAAGVWAVAATRAWRGPAPGAWFAAGVALFCAVVALEEISWGQRLVGYRPPDYFLEHNFQQELNVHNVVDKAWRVAALKAVILGFGVALPLLAALPGVRRRALQLGVLAPPVLLIPAFLATYWTYEAYPFRFSGEITEFMLALGFLFAGLAWLPRLAPPGGGAERSLGPVLVATLTVLGLGFGTARATHWRTGDDPERMDGAVRELYALRGDFLQEARRVGGLPTRCGLHKRIYTYRTQYRRGFLDEGFFAKLQQRGLPESRAVFFLDPWNSPYWVRDHCEAGRRVVFVYSLGPNRRRDSGKDAIGGDDVGAVVSGELAPPIR